MRKIIILNLILLVLILSVNSTSGDKSTLKNKNTGKISYKSGNLYFKKDKYLEAIKMYKKAISSGFENDDIYYELSICYREIKKYIKSIYYLDEAIETLEKEVQKLINHPSFFGEIKPRIKSKPSSTPVSIPLKL